MTGRKLGAVALLIGSFVIFALPSGSFGAVDLRQKLTEVGQQLQTGLETTVQKTGEATAGLLDKTTDGLKKATTKSAPRATATDPATQPPAHGTNPHAQGSVAVVDLSPSSERPLAADPDGGDAGEDVVVGRARGEQDPVTGAYHGHITVLGLFGNDIIPIDTKPGETKNGPLQGLQTSVLDPLCTSTSGQVCLSVLTANSSTTSTGTTNDFAIARASLLGLKVGAAESHGNVSQDATCQTADGSSKTANVATATGAIAGVANSQSVSKSCRGAAPVVTNTSQVIQLGGTGVALPAAGCANGTPDTQAGLPGLLPIICNADEVAAAAGVREALDVFALQLGTSSLVKETTAASASLSVAPAESGAQCSDGVDNDGDGLVDAADPGCHSDGNPNNDASYVPSDNNEADSGNGGSGGGGGNNGGGGSGNDGSGGGGSGSGPQCADNRDNDGDGLVDENDPGCHSDGDASNPDSYNASDDSEGGNGGGGAGGGGLDAGALPFTGTDVIGLSLAGLLVLAGGLLLRRREDVRTAR